MKQQNLSIGASVGLIVGFVFLGFLSANAAFGAIGEIEDSVRYGSSSKAAASIGAGYGAILGESGMGLSVSLSRPVAGPIDMTMGLDIDAYQISFAGARDPLGSLNGSVRGGSVLLFNVLPTFMYHPKFLRFDRFKPFFALSVGPSWYLARGTLETGDVSETLVLLAVLARPGLSYEINRDLSVQMSAKLGYLGEDSLLLTQADLKLSL